MYSPTGSGEVPCVDVTVLAMLQVAIVICAGFEGEVERCFTQGALYFLHCLKSAA